MRRRRVAVENPSLDVTSGQSRCDAMTPPRAARSHINLQGILKENLRSGWGKHSGGCCPVPPEILVDIRYRNGFPVVDVAAGSRRWESWPEWIGPSDWDIVEWRFASGVREDS